MSSYCDVAPGDPLHGPYHDTEYGFPEIDEGRLFERLVLEIHQAGLSWALMLKKRAGYREAFAGWNIDHVASWGADDVGRLLADPRIVRNRLKVEATLHNARVLREMRARPGGFAGWLAAHHPQRKQDWVKLFKKTFRFTGGEITGELLMSIGYLPGSHRPSCPVFTRIAALSPPWMSAPTGFWS